MALLSTARAAMALIAIVYRISLNLPDMPYSVDLKDKQSEDFAESAQQVMDSVDFMLKQLPGYYNVSVREFRYQQVVGTMVILDVISTNTKNIESVKKLFEEATQTGHIGWLAVAPEGFEFHSIKVNGSSDGKFDLAAAKSTSTCPDGSSPEYSLHGSTYCWSHSVCPSGTACIQSQCCKTAPGSTIRKCAAKQWECSDGSCLPYHQRCDDLLDCYDKSDELFCLGNEKRSVGDGKCSGHEFQCDSGECISKDQECNRKYDCQDGSDETKCDYFVSAQRSRHQPDQQQQQQQQQESRQVNTQQSNVPVPQNECSDLEFRCPYLPHTKCIHYEKLCDGINDCGDYSDEQKCESGSVEDNACKTGEYQCQNGQCIDINMKCNHKYDCEDGSDETVCDYFKHSQKASHQGSQQQAQQREQQREQNVIQEPAHPAISREQYERERQLAERERELARRAEEEARRESVERQREEQERQREAHARRPQESSQQSDAVTFEPKHEVVFKEEYDDASCLQHEFMCHTGECIDKRRVCDTRSDCLDGSDERDCHNGQPSDHAEGRHHLPPAPPVIEDDWPEDIDDQSDEEIYGQSTQPPRPQQQQQPQTRPPSPPPHHPHQGHQQVHHHATRPPPGQPDAPQQLRPNVGKSTDDLQITVYPHEHSVREGRDVSFECRARTSDNGVYPSVRWTRSGDRMPAGAHDSGGRLSFAAVTASDSGRYVCLAEHNGRTVESYATLTVVSFGPQELQGGSASSGSCMSDEKACGTNECVKSDYVCDGESDCRDHSDEQNCPIKRLCEPNEFKCSNDRCIQLMWKCDGDDDCGDGSDELSCGSKKPGDLCQPTEFKCRDGRQCVPQSFQCDGTNDCLDGSDEIGCVQPTVVEPPITNKEVPQGDSFQLTCRAVAVPEAYINWRLNWGPVCDPPRCVQESEGGVGTLTVNNAQPLDQGAYTCEAINVKGRVLATPDCIVRIVNIPAPPPPPPREPQRMSCDPVGAVSPVAESSGGCQCKPLVTGPSCNQCKPGSFHLNDKAPHGCLKCFCFGITDQCRSADWFRTKEKLFFNGDSEGVTLSSIDGRSEEANFDYHVQGMLTNSEPHRQTLYWNMPQRFKGDKVTAYGGQMSLELQYSGTGPVSSEPLVVLKGNGITLVHKKQDSFGSFQPDRPVHVTVDTFETNYERENGSPASREDLMMVLADLDDFLIRATHVPNQVSTSLGDVSWEIAVDRDTQEGHALEVEQCTCPPGYVGLSCEDCAPGYERSGHGPYLGTCVPVRQTPPPQRACPPGAISPVAGYDGRCQCKPNLTGPNCDQCAAQTFNPKPQSPQGCSKCWCNGITNSCRSSSYRRTTVEIDYRRGDQDQLEIGSGDTRSEFSPRTRPDVYDRAINFANFEEANGQTLYWKLPEKFLGDKVTSYGGLLKYTIRFSGSGNINPDADVILKGNQITLQHRYKGQLQADRENVIEVPISEEHWERADGQPTTRENLLMALADLDAALIKLSYNDDCASSSLVQVSLEHAEPYGQGAQAADVEQCDCTPGYVGTSCEDCAPGYSRVPGGPYLGRCERCECHNHASTCDEQYGQCVSCQHNTEGDRCERCRPGFEGDARRGTPHDCRPEATKPPCECNNHSPRGCDSYGRCLLCEHNTEGYHCESCKKGYYGDALKATPYDCNPCPCPGTSECFLSPDGAVKCKNCPAGFSGDRCDKCAPGYTISARTGGRDCEPIGRVETDRIQFVDNPAAHLRVEIHPPKHLAIKQNSRAKWTCVASGVKEHVNIEWTKIGSNSLPPHVQQVGNQLVIDSVQPTDAGQYRCTGTTVKDIATDESSLTVEAGQPLRPVVTPPYQSVRENDRAVFECIVPGVTGCEIQWHKDRVGGPLPYGVRRMGNKLVIANARREHAGDYICTVRTNFGLGESNPGKLDVQKDQWRPEAEPPFLEVDINDPARFRCFVRGVPHAEFQWRREDGQPLDNSVDQAGGYLTIQGAQLHHAGRYICSATDPQDPQQGPVDAPAVTLSIKEPAAAPLQPQVDPIQQTVDLGQPAKFRCWVDGNPNAQLRWIGRGNKALPQGAREHRGELTFPSVSQNDAGEYICMVYDPATRKYINAPPARLDVSGPSSPPQVDPPEQTVLENTPANIRCWVPGNPDARLVWHRRGGTPLPPDAYDDGQGNLSIHRAQGIHEGDYECSAEDPQNRTPPQISQPARVNVRPALNEIRPEQGAPPNPVATPPVITVPKGEPARFHCDAGSDSPAKIHWSSGHNNGPLRGDVHQDGDDLVIRSANDENAGEYVCTATNQFGTGTADPVKLVVSDDETPPTARVEPRVYTGKPGDRHQFTCHVTGLPEPTITWTGPDGGSLPDGVVDLGGGKLDFDDLQKVHEGDYTCTATNPVGEASDKGVIDLSPSLKVTTNPTGPRIILTPGEPLEIECIAEGDPDPDVEWLHDPGPERGDLPDDYVPITISEQFLRHPHIGLQNAGLYTCRGSNAHASATKDIYIEVVDPSVVATVSVLGGSKQFFQLNQPSQLVCAATGQSIVDRIEWVKVDGSLPNDVEDHNEQGLLHFGTFKPGYAGEYECRGYRKDNLIGSSNVTVYADDGTSEFPRVEISPPGVRVVNEGDSIILDCNVKGFDGDVKYKWSVAHGGTLIPEVSKEQHLEIKKADARHDYGIYKCQVDDERGFPVGSAHSAVIIGASSPEKAEDAKFEELTDAELICPVYAVPGATVTWTREGDELPHNAEPRGNKLLITGFDDTTAGLYTCTVQIDQNTIEGYVNARIFVPDTTIKVVLNVSSENVAVGDRVWLDCNVIGAPDAKIEYTKDGSDELPKGATVTGSRLLFNAVTEEDTGKYECKAHTSEGPLVTSVVINVGSAKLGQPGDLVPTPWPSMSSEVTVVRKKPIKPIVAPLPTVADTKASTEVTIAPTYVAAPHPTVAFNREEPTHYPIEKESFVEQARRVPVIHTVGDDVVLKCGVLEFSLNNDVEWQKIGGRMPPRHEASRGDLTIKNVQKEDEGLYQCAVQTAVSFVDLKVADFVPVFHGNAVIDLPPLTEDQWRNLDLELSVKPVHRDGVILHTTQGAEGDDENYHTVSLRRGKVVYRTKLGASQEELESKWPVRVGKWSKIRVINNDRERTLIVNSDEPVVTIVGYTSEVAFSSPPPSNVHLGGDPGPGAQAESEKKFSGTISRIMVNQEPVLLDPRILSSMEENSGVMARLEQSNECLSEPCQNEGVCIVSAVHEGFVCDCSELYHGSYCQFKGRHCRDNLSCVAGACVEVTQSFKCVCPLDREGELCEKPVQPRDRYAGSYKMNGVTSYLAIPPPNSVKNFSLGMRVKLDDASKDQVIAYLGSNYNQKSAEYMSLTVKDGKFVHTYQNGGGKSLVESIVDLEPGKVYNIEVARNGHIAELTVNGLKSSTRVKTVAFPSGTSMFIGGFPPGMHPRQQIQAVGYMEGCISEIELDRLRVDIDGVEGGILSGDLQECETESRGDQVVLEATQRQEEQASVAVIQPSLVPVTRAPPPVVEVESAEDAGGAVEAVTEAPLKKGGAGGTWDSDEDRERAPVTIAPTEFIHTVHETADSSHEIVQRTSTTTIESPLLQIEPARDEEHARVQELDKPDVVATEGPASPVTIAPAYPETPSTVSTDTHDEVENIAPRAQCEASTCGEHGECEVVNATHVICQCKDYYDGPNCERFKPIEHAARFEGNAYIVFSTDEFPHLTSEREETIAFRLKTTAKYGLIFWQGQQPGSSVTGEDYISIGLNDGYLVYSYELGGGAAQITSTNSVNDGHEHIVKAVRKGRNGTLLVDNEPHATGSSSGILAMLNVEGDVYIGGVPDLELMTGGLHAHNLVGCVADVMLNGQKLDLMADAVDGVNVKPCDSWRTSRRKWMKSRKYKKLVIG